MQPPSSCHVTGTGRKRAPGWITPAPGWGEARAQNSCAHKRLGQSKLKTRGQMHQRLGARAPQSDPKHPNELSGQRNGMVGAEHSATPGYLGPERHAREGPPRAIRGSGAWPTVARTGWSTDRAVSAPRHQSRENPPARVQHPHIPLSAGHTSTAAAHQKIKTKTSRCRPQRKGHSLVCRRRPPAAGRKQRNSQMAPSTATRRPVSRFVFGEKNRYSR